MSYELIIFAQSEGPSGTGATDVFTMLFQYGIPGLVIAAILVGLLWAKPSVDRLIKDKERAEAQRDQLLSIYEEKMLPALADSIAITRDLKPVMQDVTTILAQVRDDMSRRIR